MARRKIVFVIVEGPSDEDALALLLSKYFKDNNEVVHVEVMHCDITSQRGVNASNIREKITNAIKKHAGVFKYKKDDYQQIIHLTDTDGAFISADYVVEDKSLQETEYTTSCIKCHNKNNIVKRNEQKSTVLNAMLDLDTIWTCIPYKVYYMSCNLDHVLYNELNSTDGEKESNAISFAKKYREDLDGFISFISNSDFSVCDSYEGTWNYIKTDLNSLNRHTNLGLCFFS